MQQILDATAANGRKAAYVGRSMVRNMAIAQELGYLNVPPGVLVDPKDLSSLPPERQVLISTGSKYLRAALLQGTLPLIGFVLFLFA